MRLYQNQIKLYKNGKLHCIVMKPNGFMITYNIDSGNSISSLVSSGSSVLNYTPSKDGYTFVGWKEDTTANGNILTDKTASANMTLYAVFKKDVTLTYYDNSTTAKSHAGSIYYNNGEVNNPSFTMNQASASGWSARGWSTSNSGNATVNYSNGATITLTDNLTIYGLYQQTITVTYYNNSNSASKATGTRYWAPAGYINPSFTLAQASKSGWSARGWSTSNAGNAGITYNNNTAFTRDSNITLYGLYSASITLSYNGNGATGGSTASQPGTIYWAPAGTVGATFSLRSNGFSRSGYSFTGWNLGAAGASVTLTSSTTAYAQWKMASQSFKVYMNNHDTYDNAWEDLNVRSIDSNNYFSIDSDNRYLYCKASCNVSVSYTYNNGGGDGRLWMRKYYAGTTHEWPGLGEGDGLSGSASFSVNAGEYISWQVYSHYATGDGQIVMRTDNLTFTFTATAT